MKQEKVIYQFLNKRPEGNWPKIYYDGFLSNNEYYAIFTKYIDGVCYTKEEMKALSVNKLILPENYCKTTNVDFRANGIAHLDIREPNLIFKDNIAFIIDFGFSQITDSTDHFCNDFNLLNGNLFNVQL